MGMPGLVCPCMRLLSDWLLSLKPANALVKQSAETIDHRMWQRQGVCRSWGFMCGGVHAKNKVGGFSGRGRAKSVRGERGMGRGRQTEESMKGEKKRERWYWVEVDAGQWRCRWPINLGLFLPSYCVFLLARD